MTRERALQQAQAEGLTLRKSNNTTGYANVFMQSGTKPYKAEVSRSGASVHLGSFITAEEAALCLARLPERQAAAAAAAAAVLPKVPLTGEQALQQAEAEGLTLRKADNKAGYANVSVMSGAKPYIALVGRSGGKVHLGSFATAEEAALCIARSPEGLAAAAAAAVPPMAPLTREQALQQAQAEGLALRKADSKSGYANVSVQSTGTKPYLAKASSSGQTATLGTFATAEEAALCVARSPEGQAAAKREAAPPPIAPMTREQALQQAQAEGLTLRKGDNKAGYASVSVIPGRPKPHQAKVWRGGRTATLGYFATAEEAALCVARTLEGQAAVERAAAAPPPIVSGEEEGESKASACKEEGMVPPMPAEARWSDAVKAEGMIPPMPSDAIVKQEPEVADNEEEHSHDDRRKRSKTE